MAKNHTYQNKNIYKDFDIGFSRNPLTDDISKKSDVNAITQSLKNLIMTSYYERPFRPDVGCRVRSLLFELVDPITIIEIRKSIEEVIENYEPRVILDHIYVRDYSELNAYSIEIQYRIQNVFEPQELKVTLKRLR